MWELCVCLCIANRKRKLVALLLLSYRCIVTLNVLWLFLTVPWVGLERMLVVFPDHTHLLYDLSKSWPPGGLPYRGKETSKNLLLNHLSEFKIICGKWSLGGLLQKWQKQILSVEKHGRKGAWPVSLMYLYRKKPSNIFSSELKMIWQN